MNFKLKKTLIMVLTMLLVCGNLSAHSGRTDSNGGHKDNKNKSGLGPYHYHCGGYPAHLHEDGVCPYKSANTKRYTTSTSNSKSGYREKSIKFDIDNKAVEISGVMVNYTNLVELRGLCDNLGIAILSYDTSTKIIECQKDDINFKLQIDSRNMYRGTELITLDVAPIAYNGKTMIPARAVAQVIGKTVTHDSSTNNIVIK